MRFNHRPLTCFAAALLLAGGAAAQSDSERAVIRFADLNGGIRNWKADGDRAMFVQGRNRQWYRATFFAPCVGLRFAPAVAFVTDSLGNLDEFSSILVDGERCWFDTFERSSGPDAEEGPGFDVEEVEPGEAEETEEND